MEFIKVEEFLKQPVEVQKVLLDWWKPSIGDLVSDKEGILEGIFSIFDDNYVNVVNTDKYKVIPNLTEGQLRKFIEDKTNKKFNIELLYNENNKQIEYAFFEAGYCSSKYHSLGTDLLQAYWKVALEIAKEKVQK